MPPKVIRKVRTPEGKKRYGQPIGAIITKDMQVKAHARFRHTPWTVQYGLGVLTFEQLQKVAKKQKLPPWPAHGTPVIPESAKKVGLQTLWGLWVDDFNGWVYRWDRSPDGKLNFRTVTESDLPASVKAQLPKNAVFASEAGIIDLEGHKIQGVWLDEKHLPPEPKPEALKKDMDPSDEALLGVGEGDYALKPPDEKMAQEPSLRWQKVDSSTVTTAFQKKMGTLQSPLYRLFLDYQSVGLVAKTDKGWILLHNGKKATPYFKTKAQVAAEATQLWMDGTLIPDGKASLPDPNVEVVDLDPGDVLPPTGPEAPDLDEQAEQALQALDDELAATFHKPTVQDYVAQQTMVTVYGFNNTPMDAPTDSLLIVVDFGGHSYYPVGYAYPGDTEFPAINGDSIGIANYAEHQTAFVADPVKWSEHPGEESLLVPIENSPLMAQKPNQAHLEDKVAAVKTLQQGVASLDAANAFLADMGEKNLSALSNQATSAYAQGWNQMPDWARLAVLLGLRQYFDDMPHADPDVGIRTAIYAQATHLFGTGWAGEVTAGALGYLAGHDDLASMWADYKNTSGPGWFDVLPETMRDYLQTLKAKGLTDWPEDAMPLAKKLWYDRGYEISDVPDPEVVVIPADFDPEPHIWHMLEYELGSWSWDNYTSGQSLPYGELADYDKDLLERLRAAGITEIKPTAPSAKTVAAKVAGIAKEVAADWELPEGQAPLSASTALGYIVAHPGLPSVPDKPKPQVGKPEVDPAALAKLKDYLAGYFEELASITWPKQQFPDPEAFNAVNYSYGKDLDGPLEGKEAETLKRVVATLVSDQQFDIHPPLMETIWDTALDVVAPGHVIAGGWTTEQSQERGNVASTVLGYMVGHPINFEYGWPQPKEPNVATAHWKPGTTGWIQQFPQGDEEEYDLTYEVEFDTGEIVTVKAKSTWSAPKAGAKKWAQEIYPDAEITSVVQVEGTPTGTDYGHPTWTGATLSAQGSTYGYKLFEDSPWEIFVPSNSLLVFDPAWNDEVKMDTSVLDGTPLEGLSGIVTLSPDGKCDQAITYDTEGGPGWGDPLPLPNGKFPTIFWDEAKVLPGPNLEQYVKDKVGGSSPDYLLVEPDDALKIWAPSPEQQVSPETLDAIKDAIPEYVSPGGPTEGMFTVVSNKIGSDGVTRVVLAITPNGSVFRTEVGPQSFTTPNLLDWNTAGGFLANLDQYYTPTDDESADALELFKKTSLQYKMHHWGSVEPPWTFLGWDSAQDILEFDGKKPEFVTEDVAVDLAEVAPVESSLQGLSEVVLVHNGSTWYLVGGHNHLDSYAKGQYEGTDEVVTKTGYYDISGLDFGTVPVDVAKPEDSTLSVPMAGGGSQEFTVAQVQEALDVLKAAKGMMIKQPLAKDGNPLAGSDYHQIAEPYQADFAGEKFHTKLAYMKALEQMLAAAQSQQPEIGEPEPGPEPELVGGLLSSSQIAQYSKKIKPALHWYETEDETHNVSVSLKPEGDLLMVSDGSPLVIPGGAVVMVGVTNDPDDKGSPEWYQNFYGWVDSQGTLHNFGSEKQKGPYQDWLKTWPANPGTLKFLPASVYVKDIAEGNPVIGDAPGHYDTFEQAKNAIWEAPKAGAKKSSTAKPKPPSPLHPAAMVPPGRWAKPGAKGYLDVLPDGSGVYTSPGGKASHQSPTQVRKRIEKGLTLQVAASDWPHHGQVYDEKTGVFYVAKVGSDPEFDGRRFYVRPDGSVEVKKKTGISAIYYSWEHEKDLTAEEFAEVIKDALDKGIRLMPDSEITEIPNTSYANIPLFTDIEAMKKAADQEGGFSVFGMHIDSSEAGFFDALDSEQDWLAYLSKWSGNSLQYKPFPHGMDWDEKWSVQTSPEMMRIAILQMLGQYPDTHTPSQQGRYTQQGPFWANTETGAVFAPRGAVREIARGRITPSQLKSPELSTLIDEAVADLGLQGILFTKKGGLNKAKKIDWLWALQTGDFAKIKELEKAAGNDSPMLDHLPDKVYWEGPVPGEYPSGMKVPGPPQGWSSPGVIGNSLQEVDNYLIAAKMRYPEYLSVEERKQWVQSQMQGSGKADGLSLTARNRFLAGGDPLTPAPKVTLGLVPQKTWTAMVKDGTVFTTTVKYYQVAPHQDWYGDEIAGKTLAQVQQQYPGHDAYFEALFEVAGHVSSDIGAKVFGTDAPNYNDWNYARKAQADWFDKQSKIPVLHIPAKKNPALKKDPSTHPVYFVKDQFDKDWVFKEMPEKFRVDVELMATKIAHLYGYSMPEAFAVVNAEGEHHSLGGKIGFVSAYTPNSGTLSNVDVSTLTPMQLTDLALDHVLDWLLDNDDSRPGNYLLADDGHLVAIDKSRAYKHFGTWKGLSGNKAADSNMIGGESLASTEMFQAIKKHKISESQAQVMYREAVKKAQAIQDAPWEPLAALIEEGNKDRTQWYPSSTPQNISQLLAKVKARKEHMASDIESVWAKVFAEAGYEPPPVPKPPAKQRYTQVTPQFDANLQETKILGQSLLVAGSDWEDGHILLWQEKMGPHPNTAQPVVRGMGHIFGPRHKDLYQDLYDASEVQSTAKPETPEVKVRDAIDSWRSSAEMEFVQFSKDHSNFVLKTDKGKQVTPEQIDTAAASALEGWQKVKAQIAKSNPTVNPAYLEMFDAQVAAWISGMETELKAAIAENRKVERPPLYYPMLPVISSPGAAKPSWDEVFNTVVDKYGEEHVLEPDDPRWMKPPAIKEVPPLFLDVETPQQAQTIWEQRFPELAAMGITLSVRQIKGTHGTLHPKTLDLVSKDGDGLTTGWEGYEYVLKLPTGEEVMVAGPSKTIKSSGSSNGPPFGPLPFGQDTLASRAGMIRFEGKKGESASQVWKAVKPVLATLVPVEEPTDFDLQLLYYRMLVGSYRHVKYPTAKYAKVLQDYNNKVIDLGGKPGDVDLPLDQLGELMDPADEVAFWKQEMAYLVGQETFDKFDAVEGWRPRFETDPRSSLPTGHPFWYRADVDPIEVLNSGKWLKQSGMPAGPFVWTGMQCTDDRTRITGQYIHGSSSTSDQANGAGTVVYTSPKPVGHGGNVVLSPLAAMRVGTYGWDDGEDHWGKPWFRQSLTPVSPVALLKSAYEVLPKWVLWWNDALAIQCNSHGEREGLITELHKLGIKEIQGIPVEDFLVYGDVGKQAKKNFEIRKKQMQQIMDTQGWL